MPFLFFQISNDYCQKSYGKIVLFYNGFRGFLWSATTSQIFLIYTFLTNGPFKNVWTLHGNTFCFFIFFLNERNITTSFLMIHLKCTVIYYANLNSRSISKPFVNYRPLNMLFCLFRLHIYVYFKEAFVIFSFKFPKFISQCGI